LGIPAHGVGRRRGRSLAVTPAAGHGPPTGTVTFTGTLGLIVERFQHESTQREQATEDLLAERIRAAHEAHEAGDQFAYEDALIDIASAAGLVHQHQRRLRRAA
jgi:hypothetical protein